ncbi:hypothetical protein [Actinokineospora iranica]|uniref:DUF4352 domain-containing protein n=1 Tax=Actinokineospora iranica TaxID=1271860 RepID=A0A1G6X470_9PSEU|nr:hypothetical protein [Actinokineospora iranica]SDD72908.1 hypothetical protein SAMN05216174_11697 [Actinokineospora iranica]
MKTVGLAAATSALVVVLTTSACGGGPATAQAGASTTTGEKIARSAGPLSRATDRTDLGNGISIVISAPKSFVPTASASPVVPRGVGFDMTLENNGTTPYRPTLLSLSASANGTSIQQVVDSTQGYSGVLGQDEILPGRSARFSVAFAVPAEKAAVRVDAQPDPGHGATVTVFDGVA